MSTAQKKAHGALALAKLLKKSKRTAEPVVIAHRKRQSATTFWGKAWSDNLERYADLANRLPRGDRKSTRLNSSHGYISYAVFCLKKKKRIWARIDTSSSETCSSSATPLGDIARASAHARLW